MSERNREVQKGKSKIKWRKNDLYENQQMGSYANQCF